MNKTRRSALAQATEALREATQRLSEALADITLVRDEEQEVFENLDSAGLGATEQAQAIEEAADTLDNACSEIESAIDTLEAEAESLDGLL